MTEQRSTVEILRAAKERISDPSKWCRVFHARDASNNGADPTSDKACRWCARGALLAECGINSSATANEAERRLYVPADELLRRAAGPQPVINLNDGGQHDAVMALYDKAIALAEARA